jgi:hypothetical protein
MASLPPLLKRRVPLAAALLAVVALGCGRSGSRPSPQRATVTGTVTLDGAPLDEGEITFLAFSGAAADVLPVRKGAFSGSVSVGPQRVQFAAHTTVKRSIFPDQPPVDVQENALPVKYHAESTLQADIKPGANPPLRFELRSDPKNAAKPAK